jgi:hypothetical protein
MAIAGREPSGGDLAGGVDLQAGDHDGLVGRGDLHVGCDFVIEIVGKLGGRSPR